MGGDNAPAAIIQGAAAAAAAFGIDVILTGRSGLLRPLLAAQARPGAADGSRPGQVRIVTADDSLAMDEGALASLRRPRSSAAIACQLVRRGLAQAAVSAGSTGGTVAAARLRLRSLPGVMRPGLLTIGAEPGKGNRLTRRAHELLAGAPPHGGLPLHFVGNVEGGDLLAGKA